MESHYLLHLGRRVVHLGPGLKEIDFCDLPKGEEALRETLSARASAGLVDWTRASFGEKHLDKVGAGDPLSRKLLERAHIQVLPLSETILRKIRERVFYPLPPRALVALASAELRERFASPEEQITALSRECDRLERLRRREEEFASYLALSSGEGTPIAAHLARSTSFRKEISQTLGEAEKSLEGVTRKLLPSLSTLLGYRTAARLLTEATSVLQLGKLTPSRIQLIGARRRSPGRNPRHGLIYLADGMERVPADRRGALARTLGGLAAVAIRADLLTHQDRIEWLLRKKEGRIRELLRQKDRRGNER